MMTLKTLFLLLCGLLVLAIGGWLLWTYSPAAPTAIQPRGGEIAPAPDREWKPLIGEAPKPVTSPATEKGLLALPNGTYVPNLNGLDDVALRIDWDGRPFPAITGTIVGRDGIEWYMHEDGSQTTTVRQPGTDEHGRKVMRILINHATPTEHFPIMTGLEPVIEDKDKKPAGKKN